MIIRRLSLQPQIPVWRQILVGSAGLLLTFWCGFTELPTQAADYVGTVTNTPSLLGYWRFDPPFLTNSWVNGFTGTNIDDAVIGAPGSGCPLASLPSNQGLVLDGNGYLASDLVGQITNQFTLMAWVNIGTYPGNGTDPYYEIIDQQQNGDDCDLIVFPDGTIHFFTDAGGNDQVGTPNPVPLNEWHFIVGTMTNNGPRRIYLDGQLVGANTAGTHSVSTTALWIGYGPVFTPRHFVGSIDEVAVFNRALAASEVAAIYLASEPSNLGTLDSLSLSGIGSLAATLTAQASVTAVYSSGASFDVAGLATYTSSDTNVVTVSASGLVSPHLTGSATITASYGGLTSTQAVAVIALQSVSLSGIPQSLQSGSSVQAVVTATFSGGTNYVVTGQASYSSSNTNVVTVSASGLVSAHLLGLATVTATYGGLASSQTVMVDSTSVNSYERTVIDTPGLLGYWTFDGAAPTNSLFNGYTGTLGGDALIGAPGSGAPLAGDPSNQGLVLDSNPGTSLATDLFTGINDQFTLMAWIYITDYVGATSYPTILSKGSPGDDCDLIVFPDGTIHFYTDAGGQDAVSTANPVPLNEWHFIAGTMVSGGPRQIYLDGQLAGANVAGTHTANDTLALLIGDSASFGPRNFAGTIDEAAVFNRALAASEVAAIYLASGPTNLGTVQSISLSGIPATLSLGLTAQASVMATYSSGASFDVTGLARYSSSNTNAVTVSASGLVSAHSSGSATVTATYGSLVSTQAVNVSVQSVVLTIERQGAGFELGWAAGVLESATSVLGPWGTVTNASPPTYQFTPAQGDPNKRFFRARLN